MNEKNFDYLQNQLKYLGFGDKLADVLRSAIKSPSNDFILSVTGSMHPYRFKPEDVAYPAPNDTMRHVLHFRKGTESDLYFLNAMDATLIGSERREPVSRRFAIDSAYHVTAMDSYHLLSGRFVEKKVNVTPAQDGGEGESKKIWLGLDLEVTNHRGQHPIKTFHEQYGYDLEKAIEKYRAGGFASTKEADARYDALRRGNLVATVIPIGKKDTPVWIAANPEMKGLDVYERATLNRIPNWDIFPEMKKAMEEKRAAIQAATAEASASASAIPELNPVAKAEGRTQGGRR